MVCAIAGSAASKVNTVVQERFMISPQSRPPSSSTRLGIEEAAPRGFALGGRIYRLDSRRPPGVGGPIPASRAYIHASVRRRQQSLVLKLGRAARAGPLVQPKPPSL